MDKVKDIYETLTEKQKIVVNALIGQAIKDTALDICARFRNDVVDLTKVKAIKSGRDYFIMDDSISNVISAIEEDYVKY